MYNGSLDDTAQVSLLKSDISTLKVDTSPKGLCARTQRTAQASAKPWTPPLIHRKRRCRVRSHALRSSLRFDPSRRVSVRFTYRSYSLLVIVYLLGARLSLSFARDATNLTTEPTSSYVLPWSDNGRYRRYDRLRALVHTACVQRSSSVRDERSRRYEGMATGML